MRIVKTSMWNEPLIIIFGRGSLKEQDDSAASTFLSMQNDIKQDYHCYYSTAYSMPHMLQIHLFIPNAGPNSNQCMLCKNDLHIICVTSIYCWPLCTLTRFPAHVLPLFFFLFEKMKKNRRSGYSRCVPLILMQKEAKKSPTLPGMPCLHSGS